MQMHNMLHPSATCFRSAGWGGCKTGIVAAGGLTVAAFACGARDRYGCRGAKLGDRIGLALDCDRGTLAVYINGERLGVMLPWELQAGPMEPSWQGPKRLDGPW